MTTYADLLTATADHLRAGNAQLATDRFWTANQAQDAIVDFHGMLHAVAYHTRRLLWPAKAIRPGMDRRLADLSLTEDAAARLATAIDALVGTGVPHPAQLTPLTTPWRHAAMHLRAASDLVATHFHSDGSPRTPYAAATDTRALEAGLTDLGHLAAITLAAEEPLALRALQAGVNEAVLVTHLPGPGHLTDLARAAASDKEPDIAARAHLGALGPTTAPIRTDDPVTELGDRMRRLRLTTWDLRATPGDPLATLRDLTTIGIAVHAHTAAFHGSQPMTAAEPATSAHGADALVRRGRAWQTLHRELSHFLTLEPPHAVVRDDLVALTRLLPAIAPLDSRTNTAALADPAARRIGAGLNGAVTTMTQIADHSGATFADLARAGRLHLNARDLPRDLVTDSAQLAAARLSATIVGAPTPVISTVLRAYDVVRNHPIHGADATTAHGTAGTLVEVGVAPLSLPAPGR